MKKLYEIIEMGKDDDLLSKVYDYFIIVTIFISVVPMMFAYDNILFSIIDYVTVTIFIIDYILRLLTAKFKVNKGWKSFFIFPFTPFAIIDLLSILPSFTILNNYFKLLKTFRFLKCLRVFKTLRFSKNFNILINVFTKQKKILLSILAMALGYIFFSALIMFNVEQTNFNSFFDAIYWAVTALTTVGYGDIYPITILGKIVSIISSLFGVALVALPSGVLTAGFIQELEKKDGERNNE